MDCSSPGFSPVKKPSQSLKHQKRGEKAKYHQSSVEMSVIPGMEKRVHLQSGLFKTIKKTFSRHWTLRSLAGWQLIPAARGWWRLCKMYLPGMRANGSALNVRNAGRIRVVYPGHVPATFLRCPLLPLWVTYQSHLWLEVAKRITSESNAVKRTLPYFWCEWTITACPK